MSEETDDREQTRRVTKCLADLDILFSFGRDQNGRPLWGMNFTDPSLKGPAAVTVRIERGWVFVYHLDEAADPVPSDADLLSQLLKLNADIAVAKIGLDLQGRLLVLGNIPLRDLSPESLSEGIGACLAAVGSAREILAGERRFQLSS